MLVASCGTDHSAARFDGIEEALATNPDSVLAALEGMGDADLTSARARALHGLYSARARQICHLELTDDSLLLPAEKYFRAHGQEEELMKTLYHIGVVNRVRRRVEPAMVAAEESRKMAEGSKDAFWSAKTNELVADIFSESYNPWEGLEARKRAATFYKEAGRELNHLYALADMAVDYDNMEKHDRAVSILDSLTADGRLEPWPDMQAYCYHLLMNILIKKKDYIRAETMADSLMRYDMPLLENSEQKASLATLRYHRGDYRGMDSLCSLAWELARVPEDSLRVFWIKLHYHERMGDLKMAMAMEDSVLAVNNRQIEYAIGQSALATQRELMRAEMAARDREALWRSRLEWMAGVAAVMIVGALIFYFREVVRRKEAELTVRIDSMERLSARFVAVNDENRRLEARCEETAERNERLEADLESRDRRISDLSDMVEAARERKNEIIMREIAMMFAEQWSALNNLCSSYNKMGDAGKHRTIVDGLERELRRLRRPEVRRRIEEVVNTVKDGLASRLREQMGACMKDEDVWMTVLLFAGLTPAAVIAICGLGEKNFYWRRTKVRALIESVSPRDRDEFMAELG